jgi:hypothetical protein
LNETAEKTKLNAGKMANLYPLKDNTSLTLKQYERQERHRSKSETDGEESVTKDGIKESEEATYEKTHRLIEYQMRKDGGNRFQQKVDKFEPDYTVLHPRRRYLSRNGTQDNA